MGSQLVPSLPRRAWIVLGGDMLCAVGTGMTLPFFVVYLTRVRGIDLRVAGLALATFLAFVPLLVALRGTGERLEPARDGEDFGGYRTVLADRAFLAVWGLTALLVVVGCAAAALGVLGLRRLLPAHVDLVGPARLETPALQPEAV